MADYGKVRYYGHLVTFTTVQITQAGAAYKLLHTGVTGTFGRLHALIGTLEAAGSIQIWSDDNGAGANQTALSGLISMDANGGLVIPFNPDPRGCVTTVSGKFMSLQSVGDGFNGYAVVSSCAV